MATHSLYLTLTTCADMEIMLTHHQNALLDSVLMTSVTLVNHTVLDFPLKSKTFLILKVNFTLIILTKQAYSFIILFFILFYNIVI